jgi:hypothetical protein
LQVYRSRLSTLYISSSSILSNISFTKSWLNLGHFFNSCWNAYRSFTKDHFQYPAYIWVVSTRQSSSIRLFNEVFIKCHIITQIDTTFFLNHTFFKSDIITGVYKLTSLVICWVCYWDTLLGINQIYILVDKLENSLFG